jgi:membrane-associated phospholipid phosphatase
LELYKRFIFSGHVAVPFLGYLIFKESKIRGWFLFGSFFMGTVALMTKLHYSIDVFSAFFIGYAIFELGNWIFTKKTFKFIKIPYIK